MKKILILGSLGFTGRNLIKRLRKNPNVEVVGVDRFQDESVVDHVCNLCDKKAVSELLHAVRPDRIYNVAGSITNNYEECYASNVIIPKNLLDSMESMKSTSRLLLVGSSAEYGLVSAVDLPVRETHFPNPVSMYGMTKVYQSTLMMTYRTLFDLNIVMVRPFNLKGDGISENLFQGRLQKSINDFKAGRIKKITTGYLGARRDYIHIDDALVDFESVMENGSEGEAYNIGSGRSVLLRDFLVEILRDHGLDLSVVDEMPLQEKSKLDVPDIYADITKVKSLQNRI